MASCSSLEVGESPQDKAQPRGGKGEEDSMRTWESEKNAHFSSLRGRRKTPFEAKKDADDVPAPSEILPCHRDLEARDLDMSSNRPHLLATKTMFHPPLSPSPLTFTLPSLKREHRKTRKTSRCRPIREDPRSGTISLGPSMDARKSLPPSRATRGTRQGKKADLWALAFLTHSIILASCRSKGGAGLGRRFSLCYSCLFA